MGDLNSIGVAQEVCFAALRNGEGLYEPGVLRWRHPYPLSDILQGVYIDDGLVAGQYIVYDHKMKAVHHARTIAQVPVPMKWSVERIQEMLTTPWKSHEPIGPGVIHHQPADQVKTTTKSPTIRRPVHTTGRPVNARVQSYRRESDHSRGPQPAET